MADKKCGCCCGGGGTADGNDIKVGNSDSANEVRQDYHLVADCGQPSGYGASFAGSDTVLVMIGNR